MSRSPAALRFSLAAALMGAMVLGSTPVQAQTILDSWKTVAVPPPPALKPAEVVAAQAALLVLDVNVDACTEAVRPSCVRSLPHISKLLADARAHRMLVIYSTS